MVVNGTFSTNNSEGLREVALGGIGMGLLGSWSMAPNLRDGSLVARADRLAGRTHPRRPQYLRCVSEGGAHRARRARVRGVLAPALGLAADLGAVVEMPTSRVLQSLPLGARTCIGGAASRRNEDIAAGSLETRLVRFPNAV